MSATEIADGHQFQPLATRQYQPIQMISSSMGELSCQDALKEMSKTEDDNHKLSVPKIKKSKVRSMYKHQYIDEQGGAIFIKAAQVSLHIPPGALNKRTFISIEVKSASNCDVSGLNLSTSLTPIVSCQPDGLTFQKKVELVLPHCAEFDNIDLHKATARFVGGHVKVSTDSTNKQEQVSCVLKERHCHVYTTHFSDVVVGISDCIKKRMLVVPFSGGSTKLYVKVWIINDLPSEYTILLHEEKELNFVPFSHTGKFIFENHGQCSLKVQSSLEDKKLEDVSEDIDIQLLFRNIRSVHDFDMGGNTSDAFPKFVTVSLLKEPVFYLKKEIQDGDGVESMQKEICASHESKTRHDEVAQSQAESDDIIDQVFTYQIDIFKEIKALLTDLVYQDELKSDLFTKVTSLQPAIFKKISSFSEDIFWKLSPDEREMIKAISSFNTDILDRVSTAQSALQKDFRYAHYSTGGAYKTIISLQTEMFHRISTFVEDTLNMPPLMQADLLHKLKTLELATFERIEVLQRDLNSKVRRCNYAFFKEFTSKTTTFAAELFQRLSLFHEDFLRLPPMGLDDIATEVTVLVSDLLQRTSSFVKDPFLGRTLSYHQDITTMISNIHSGLFTDISTFVKGFPASMQSSGEELFTQMSSLQNDFLQLMSSLKKDSVTSLDTLDSDESSSYSSPLIFPGTSESHRVVSYFKKESDKSSSYSSKVHLTKRLKFGKGSDESRSYSSKGPLTTGFKFDEDSDEDSSYLRKDSDEDSSYLRKDSDEDSSYLRKGGEQESGKLPDTKQATAK